MSTAGIAAQERSNPLKSSFAHGSHHIGSLEACWGGPSSRLENSFFSMDPVGAACSLNSPTPHPHTCCGLALAADPARGHSEIQPCGSGSSTCHTVHPDLGLEEGVIPGFRQLSIGTSHAPDKTPPLTPVKSPPLPFAPAPCTERSTRPLPPLPIHEDFLHDEVDREVEFLTSSDTDFLLAHCSSPAFKPVAQGRRSFRGCGQINLAYFDILAGPKLDDASVSTKHNRPEGGASPPPPPPPPPSNQLHRRLRRSHSGPAGSFNKSAVKVGGHFRRASPSSDDDKPEVPPRVPIPPRVLKPDYRRWSAEVTSNTYSDEDKPPKVPPREPLSRSNSRTPSPKSLPLYLNGIMPPTQSFAPDPKYVSSKSLRRQHSEDSAKKTPCILPIIENGRKVSSTHYYLLPERPPYLDKYEEFFREVEESKAEAQQQLWDTTSGDETSLSLIAKSDLVGPMKRKHLPCMVSP
uniref:ERBB receptor feedback inhibitor 1 n=1 Tax=Salvator merianae TaxID=96440 RepID=A0A8D0DW35_SALMN